MPLLSFRRCAVYDDLRLTSQSIKPFRAAYKTERTAPMILAPICKAGEREVVAFGFGLLLAEGCYFHPTYLKPGEFGGLYGRPQRRCTHLTSPSSTYPAYTSNTFDVSEMLSSEDRYESNSRSGTRPAGLSGLARTFSPALEVSASPTEALDAEDFPASPPDSSATPCRSAYNRVRRYMGFDCTSKCMILLICSYEDGQAEG